MKKIFMAIMNEMAFLFDNDVQYMNVEMPDGYNPYHITLTYEHLNNKVTSLENYLEKEKKNYTKVVKCNKWLEYYSYSFNDNQNIYVITLKGYH